MHSLQTFIHFIRLHNFRVFDEKNSKLRQNLARVRQSRDSLKDRLKTSVSWHKNIQTTIPQNTSKV